MAYVTGTANSLADLLTAIQSACTANGWTLAGSVLYKGTCYCEITNTGTLIKAQSGSGIDGSNALTGRSTNSAAYMGGPLYFATQVNFAWPIVYDIFVGTSPDEVYAHVTFAANCHEQIGWGLSAMSGLAGSGNWYGGGNATRGSYGYAADYNGTSVEAIINGSGQANAILLADNNVSCGIDHALDGPSWDAGYGCRDGMSLFARQPSQWNGESILLPVRCYASRPSGFISPVLECAHLRFLNLTNLDDGQIITLGADRWMVFPLARRGGVAGSPGTGSQGAGHAFRYDGP
ncbi:MAG: hypothetical protein ACYCZD_12755 [Rhodanobacter sp.]